MRAPAVLLLLSFLCPASLCYGKLKGVKLTRERLSDKAANTATLHLITIGVNRYRDPLWKDLKWAVRDGDRLAAALKKGSAQTVRSYELRDGEASLANIRLLLKKLAGSVNASDTIMIYLSGHGTLQVNSQGELEPYFVLSDSQAPALATTALSQNWLRRTMDALPAKRKLLMVASCHSGLGKSKLSPEVKEFLASHKGAVLPLAEVAEGSIVFAAASKWETAEESSALQGDTYTHFFIEGLAIADRNNDGAISALEAHDHASERTYVYTKGKQRPTLEAQLVGATDIILVGKKTRLADPILQAYHPDFTGMQLAVGKGSGKSRLPLALPLKKGGNIVSLYAPSSRRPIATYRVQAAKGEVLALEELASAPFWSLQGGVARLSWQDRRYEQLFGGGGSRAMRFAASYHRSSWQLGLTQRVWSSASESVGRGVQGTLKRNLTALTLGYRRPLWAKTAVAFNLQLGKDFSSLRLADADDVTQVINRSVAAPFVGVHAELTTALSSRRGLYLVLGMGYGQANFDYGYFGHLKGSYTAFELGLRFHIWEQVTPL